MLADPLFLEIMGGLFAAAQAELLSAPVGGLTATAAHAKMLGLRDLQAGLQSIIDDEKILLNHKGGEQ